MPTPSTVRRLADWPNASVLTLLAALLVGVLVVGAIAVAPAAGAASVQDDANESGNDSIATNATELQPIDVANASGNDTEPIELSGEGQTVTDQFELDDGLVVAEYDHDGESNFQITLWDESADEAVIDLTNEIGSVEGTSAEGVTAGNYSLDVNADGAWNVTLIQPNATAVIAAQAGNDTAENGSAETASDANGTDGDDVGNETAIDDVGNETDGAGANATATNLTIANAPAVASGEGPAVVGPVDFERSVTVTANHTGESNFQVTIYPESATSFLDAAYVYNEIGEVEAAEMRVDHQGVSWVVIDADGEWDLRFEES